MERSYSGFDAALLDELDNLIDANESVFDLVAGAVASNTEPVAVADNNPPAPPSSAASGAAFRQLAPAPIAPRPANSNSRRKPPPPPTAPEPLREQDRLLPMANVARLMACHLPKDAKIARDAKVLMQEMVSEFICFMTAEANDMCMAEGHKAISTEDHLNALEALDLGHYLPVMDAAVKVLPRFRAAATTDMVSPPLGVDSPLSSPLSSPLPTPPRLFRPAPSQLGPGCAQEPPQQMNGLPMPPMPVHAAPQATGSSLSSSGSSIAAAPASAPNYGLPRSQSVQSNMSLITSTDSAFSIGYASEGERSGVTSPIQCDNSAILTGMTGKRACRRATVPVAGTEAAMQQMSCLRNAAHSPAQQRVTHSAPAAPWGWQRVQRPVQQTGQWPPGHPALRPPNPPPSSPLVANAVRAPAPPQAPAPPIQAMPALAYAPTQNASRVPAECDAAFISAALAVAQSAQQHAALEYRRRAGAHWQGGPNPN